jgi:amino acid transporter
MLLAGPIEFSTTDIILILLVLAASALALPVAIGAVAVILYRRRTPADERDPRAMRLTFFKAAAAGLLAQVVLGALVGWISELIG